MALLYGARLEYIKAEVRQLPAGGNVFLIYELQLADRLIESTYIVGTACRSIGMFVHDVKQTSSRSLSWNITNNGTPAPNYPSQ